MDWKIILCILSICFCSVVFLVQTVKIVKFAVTSRREGVKAAKLRISLPLIIVLALTIWFIWQTAYWFNRADECRKGAAYAESMIGTDYVEYYVKQKEEEKGIVILDPEKYYFENIEYTKNMAFNYTWMAIGGIVWGIDGLLTIIGSIVVITKQGLRNISLKDTIPIFAEYDRPNNKIIVKANDLNGKTEELLTFNATPKNLASLGQFIVWEEQTIQEETL